MNDKKMVLTRHGAASEDDRQRVQALREHIRTLDWSRGDPYPDLDLPDGFGFSYNSLSGGLIIMETRNIGVPYLDPKFETYHCM